jgi:drug/metabolite transporter (DMT)-like permease
LAEGIAEGLGELRFGFVGSVVGCIGSAGCEGGTGFLGLMVPALFATVLFSISVLFASRSVQVLGAARANASRMVLAMVLLGIWAHTRGGGFGGAALPWFLLSGAIGFGLGDVSMFAAISRVGPRLTILLTQCLGTPIAGLAEYFLLGVVPRSSELGCVGVILGGVGLALAPDEPVGGGGGSGVEKGEEVAGRFRVGVLFGVGSAMGQGLGAVVSRKAYGVAAEVGQWVDGGTAAYQRSVAGVVVTLLFLAWMSHRRGGGADGGGGTGGGWRRGWPLVLGNAVSGPFLGVASFQWALLTAPSATVLPVVATSPLVTMALAWGIQGVRPKRRAMVGGAMAVVGAVSLAWLREARGG